MHFFVAIIAVLCEPSVKRAQKKPQTTSTVEGLAFLSLPLSLLTIFWFPDLFVSSLTGDLKVQNTEISNISETAGSMRAAKLRVKRIAEEQAERTRATQAREKARAASSVFNSRIEKMKMGSESDRKLALYALMIQKAIDEKNWETAKEKIYDVEYGPIRSQISFETFRLFSGLKSKLQARIEDYEVRALTSENPTQFELSFRESIGRFDPYHVRDRLHPTTDPTRTQLTPLKTSKHIAND